MINITNNEIKFNDLEEKMWKILSTEFAKIKFI